MIMRAARQVTFRAGSLGSLQVVEMKNEQTTAEGIIRDMERITPYVYEGLYGNFLRSYMESD